MGIRGSIAFSDDFRGDIFLKFLTPKDDRRVPDSHTFDLICVKDLGKRPQIRYSKCWEKVFGSGVKNLREAKPFPKTYLKDF